MNILDVDIDFTIDRNYGIGLKFSTDDGCEAISVYNEKF